MERVKIKHNSESFIGAWVIDTKLCDGLINEFNINIEHAITDTSGLRNYTMVSSTNIADHMNVLYQDEIISCLKDYEEQYDFCRRNVDSFISSPFNIQRYDPGNSYNQWHIETLGPQRGKLLRKLAWITYLNDIEEGGGTQFMYQNVMVKARKGLTLIWPAGWTHPHRGVPAPDVYKFIATGWIPYSHRC